MMYLSIGIFLIFIFWWLERHKIEMGFMFYRYPYMAPIGAFGSRSNPKNVMQGYTWADYRDLFKKFKKEENSVYLDNFRFFNEFVGEAKIPKRTKERIEKTEIHIDPNKLTQGVVLCGATGTGKSEYFYSLLKQPWYQRALIHDIKQDFIKFFYRKNRDIIYNGGLDKRSHIWDVMSESPLVQEAFYDNLLAKLVGDKKDYFSSAAIKRFTDTAKAITSIYSEKSSHDKWLIFITCLKDMIVDMEKGESKSDADVSKTMEQIIEIFELSAFFITHKKRKVFIIEDFFNKDKQAKLFLSNIEKYKKGLDPMFSGFIAAFTMVHSSLDSYAGKKGNYTFYLLDEYLGFLNFLDEDTIDRIHLRLRSYGCCPVSGIQKLPNKQEIKETLLSSNYLIVFFGGSEDQVIKALEDKMKQTYYWYEDKSESIDSRGKKSVSISKRKDNVCLFTPDMMHGLGENYYHISFFVLRKTIYLGYSPQVPVKQKAEDIIYSDLSEFYKIKFKDFEVREVTNFEDIYKRKLSKLDEYKLFKKFQQAKKENKTDEFAKKENLVNVNFELLFKNYIPDDKVIDSKMSLLNADERFELLKQWQAISDDDHEAQVEFIEKHNLWGACPAIFENIGENLDDLTDL